MAVKDYEAVGMVSWLMPVWGFLKSVPSWAWVAIAAVLVVFAAYHKGASDKNAEWLANLKQAEIEAKEKAAQAASEADSEEEKRRIEFEAQQDALGKVIDNAESNGGNALDDLLNSLR